jgi:NAD(P)-dependent dehydrogenase (short-subunit alcohol dehydrogenase family)
MKIEGNVFLVTGANRGLGRSIVGALLESGAARIYAGARDPSTIGKNARVEPIELDITNAAHVAEVAKLTDLGVLINNAGVMSSYSVVSSPMEDIQRDVATNFLGPLALTRTALPAIEKNKGAIVNILTVGVFAGMPKMAGYVATKTAAFSLTQSLRGELRGRVNVHAVFAGLIDTDMAKHIPIPKAPPGNVAKEIVQGLLRNEENITPDPMSRQFYDQWKRDPLALEKAFAEL